MKAAIYNTYGGPEVLMIKDVEKPTPRNNELLIKVKATTVTAGSMLMRKGAHPSNKLFTIAIRLMAGIRKPKKQILGYEVSGIVEAVGNQVTKFQIGDEVFGTTTGLKAGACAEYVCVPEKWRGGVITKKPMKLPHIKAAALPVGYMTAMYLMNKAGISGAKNMLVYGASGSVGSSAVQLGKNSGLQVTGVCSGKNRDMVIEIGAEQVIDYTSSTFMEQLKEYDLIFDAVGKCPKAVKLSHLSKEGKYMTVNTPTKELTQNLEEIGMLAEKGIIDPFVDKSYPLSEIVEANRHGDTGHKRGNIVIVVD